MALYHKAIAPMAAGSEGPCDAKARFSLMLKFSASGLKYGDKHALELALRHGEELLEHCCRDPFGARLFVPMLLLRLGRLQLAYVFIKRWLAEDASSDDHQQKVSQQERLPCVISLGEDDAEDPFGALDISTRSDAGLLLTLLFLKLLLLFDVERAEAFAQTSFGSSLHSGLRGHVEAFLIGRCLQDKAALTLNQQASALLQAAHTANPHVLVALLDPADILSIAVASFPRGSWAEAVQIVQCIHCFWGWCPPALNYVRNWLRPPAADGQRSRKQKPTKARRSKDCSCCGAPGRVASGCSCRGGRSHTCLRRAALAREAWTAYCERSRSPRRPLRLI